MSRHALLILIACAVSAEARATIIDTSVEPADIKILGHERDPGEWPGAGAWAAVGDFNGDGLADIATSGPRENMRTVSIVFGRPVWPARLDLTLTPPDVIVREVGIPSHGSGFGWYPRLRENEWFTVLAAGDVTGDGLDDLVMAGPVWNGPLTEDDGIVLIVPGRLTWPAVIEVDPDAWSPALLGHSGGGRLGVSVHVTDFNGDGRDDILVGATEARLALGGDLGTGRVYAVPGPIADARQGIDSIGLLLDGTSGVRDDGRDTSLRLGGVIEAGVLAPSIPRGIVLGQYGHHPNGRVLILDGERLEARASVRSSQALLREILGPDVGEIIGQAVDLGDSDCSGWGDLLVNVFDAAGPDGVQRYRGRVDVYRDVLRSPDIGAPDLRIHGRQDLVKPPGQGLVQGAQFADLDGDGFDDFIISEWTSEIFAPTVTNAGDVAIVWNRPDLPTSLDLSVDSEWQVTLAGPPEGGRNYGLPIRAADVNGDGRLDLLTGAIFQSVPGSNPDGVLDIFTRNLHVTTVSPDAGADQSIDLRRGCTQTITLDASASVDSAGNAMRHRWYEGTTLLAEGEVVTVTLAAGEHCIRLFSTSDGGWAQDKVHVSVRDLVPPEIRSLSVAPEDLWPPNHRMRAVHVAIEAWDECTPAAELSYRLLSVVSNEPADDAGDGRSMVDIAGWDIGTADFDGELRAERSARGRGREYALTYEVRDAAGNAATTTLVVSVGHDRSRRIGGARPGRRLGWR